MLTANDIALVRASFAKVVPIKDAAANLFYARLFVMAPRLRLMFPADLAEQKDKLMAMIAAAVGGLDDLGKLIPAVKALGARHAGYGVLQSQYAIVGDTLIWTLAQGLGDAFTPEVRTAWVKVYGILAAAMRAGADEVAEMQAAE
jgi:nitric oxide dioxygenase